MIKFKNSTGNQFSTYSIVKENPILIDSICNSRDNTLESLKYFGVFLKGRKSTFDL